MRLLLFIFSIIVVSCTQSLEYASTKASEGSEGTTYDYPNGNGYQYSPPTNQVKFNTTSGGYFSVDKYSVFYLTSKNLVKGVTTVNNRIYLLFDNSQQFSNSYLVRSYNPSTGDYTECTWLGDGSSYIGITSDGTKLFLRSYNSSLKVRALSFACIDQGLYSPPTSTDGTNYSMITYSESLGVFNNEFLVPYQTSSFSKLKIINPITGFARDFALQQSLGSEKMTLYKQVYVDGQTLWTLNYCNSKSGTYCLWRLEADTGKIAYAYLPKEYYPLLSPNTSGARVWLTAGDQLGHIFFIVVIDGSIQVYDLNVLKFYGP